MKPTFSQLGNFTQTTTGTFGQADFAYTGIEGAIEFDKYETRIESSLSLNTVTSGKSVYGIGSAGNGSATWNAATCTRTLGQHITYSSVDGELGNYASGTGPASDAQGVWPPSSHQSPQQRRPRAAWSPTAPAASPAGAVRDRDPARPRHFLATIPRKTQ